MSELLLTDERIVELMIEYNELSKTQPYEKFGLIHYYLRAQNTETLKAVGKWLEANVKPHIATWDYPWDEMIETLLHGEIPSQPE